ncbi:MAG: hypothetical protein GY943_36095 [Chloroflexi bacterium]|nr:hypothetical protein [Chloroflexota bacterium]
MFDSHYIQVTTIADGSGDNSATIPIRGLLHAVEWVDGDLADGVDAVLSVTNTDSGVDSTLLTLTDANIDKWYYPRRIEADVTGGDLATTTRHVIAGTLKLAITSGGAVKTGGAVVYYER